MSISITLNERKKHEVSPHLYGIFYEDINFSCDGGINANMVMNYSFEGVFLDRKTESRIIDPLRGWTFTGKEITSETEDPLNENSRYARLSVEGEAELTNLGFNGDKAYAKKGAMSILPGNSYLFECWMRCRDFSGEILVDGKKIVCGKKQDMGIIIEVPGFIDHKSGIKNLDYLYRLNHKADPGKMKETMKLTGLDPESKKPVGKYSLGMRQRLAIAQAIMEDPPLLLLDEPMNGLDNQGVLDIREVLKELREKGKTIILASHSREDMSELCDTVTELDHGKVIREM